MGRKRNAIWDDENSVREAFIGALSMSDVLIKLQQPLGSANYSGLKRAAQRYGLDLPIATTKHKQRNCRTNAMPLDDILIEHSTYEGRQRIKKKINQ